MSSRFVTIAASSLLLFCHVAHSQTAIALTANPVFVDNCARCHGETAKGRHFRGPTLISEKVESASAADLRQIIRNGKGHMPKYKEKLTDKEIDVLVEQIKTLNKK